MAFCGILEDLQKGVVIEMSNPGVLTLTKKSISADKQFRVEDNLGESLHFHYNDIRIDLTIKELIYLSEICDQVIYELADAANFRLDDFDGDFLNRYSQYLIDLESVSEDYVDATAFYYQSRSLIHLPVRRKMNRSRAQKLLTGGNGTAADTSKDPYAVVLFNDNNTIMYGETKAALHLMQHPEQPLRVLRMNFENKKHTVYKFPWIPFLFKWDKKRLIDTAKKLAMKILK